MTERETKVMHEVAACLGQLLEQVYMMKGMFNNDPGIENAVDDAKKALTQYKELTNGS